MNKKIKEQWLKDLRSGEYKQSQNYLRGCDGYCCLGVLADQYLKEQGHGEWAEDSSCFQLPCGEVGELSVEIEEWAGLDGTDPRIGEHYASHLNDSRGLSFKEIAELIEEHL